MTKAKRAKMLPRHALLLCRVRLGWPGMSCMAGRQEGGGGGGDQDGSGRQGTSEEGTRHDTTVPRAESGMQGSLSRGPLPVLSFDHAWHISKGKGQRGYLFNVFLPLSRDVL